MNELDVGTRPNILYIFTDQLRHDAIGSVNPAVITPNLDLLVENATLFTRCVSNSPLCVPARAALMTGQLPRESGVWSNRAGADVEGPSHARSLRDDGYDTAVIGKTHLWRTGAGPKAGMHSGTMDAVLEKWGFDYRVEVNDPIGTGSMGCAYTDHLETLGCLDEHRRYIREWIGQMRSGKVQPWTQEPSPVPDEEDIDSFIGRSATEWLKNRDDERPFYLQVQFTGPHDPYDGPTRYRELYQADAIDPGISAVPSEPMHPWLAARLKASTLIVNATVEQRQQWRVNYYANVSLIDDWIGRILDVLAQRDWHNNTWIVFTSDHGEMLGDHGLWGKTVFHRPSVGIPLIIQAPNKIHGRHEGLVEQVDATATLLDIAGLGDLSEFRGRTLKNHALQDGSNDPVREHAISELFGETTVVTDSFKLTVHSDSFQPTQLFDLESDPSEHENVVHESKYRSEISELTTEFLEPLEPSMYSDKFEDYREYVRATGSRN